MRSATARITSELRGTLHKQQHLCMSAHNVRTTADLHFSAFLSARVMRMSLSAAVTRSAAHRHLSGQPASNVTGPC